MRIFSAIQEEARHPADRRNLLVVLHNRLVGVEGTVVHRIRLGCHRGDHRHTSDMSVTINIDDCHPHKHTWLCW
jgi:hypothetical protein